MEGKNEENREVVEQLRYLQSLYLESYENLLREISNYNIIYEATKRNLEVLSNLSMIENNKILLNLEGGTYIEAMVEGVSKVLAYVGSNYLVEKSVEEAKDFLEENKKREERLLAELNKQKEAIEKELVEVGIELEKAGNANV
ncbi:MAG: prefoldin subunit alpha [Candidatus Micrarchaeia archaeon]|jgi:prefoldin alpha subunit